MLRIAWTNNNMISQENTITGTLKIIQLHNDLWGKSVQMNLNDVMIF